MAIPAQIAADFRLIESQVFGGLDVLFDVPACADRLHDGRQGSGGWFPHQVEGHPGWSIEATTKNEGVATIHRALVPEGPGGPIKETQPLCAQTPREALS